MNRVTLPTEKIQLSPFIFPPETDSRFLLLVIAIAGSTLVLVNAFVEGVLNLGVITSFLLSVAVTIFVFIWAWHKAQRDANIRISQYGWKNFPPSSLDPIEASSLQRLATYVEAIVETIPEIKIVSPKFVWDDSSKGSAQPTGVAFGFGPQKIVCLRKGVHNLFIKLPTSSLFNAVLLHELSHIANQDVNKTIFSIALGQCFFPVALVLVILFDFYVLFSAIHKLMAGQSLTLVWGGISIILEINIKTLLLLLLVEVIRSSILRVREYYADARARQWLGSPDSFIELFSHENPSPRRSRTQSFLEEGHIIICQARQNGLVKTVKLLWNLIQHKFHAHFALLHPSNRKRIAALKDTYQLFQFNYEVAFLAGILSGLALNASFVIAPAISQFGQLIERIYQGIQNSNNGLIILIAFIACIVIWLIYLLSIIGLVMTFGLVPVVNTVGLQLQAAAFADKVSSSQDTYISPIKLVNLSLIVGVGLVLGFILMPVPNPFSLWKVPLLAVPYTLGWASIFCIWLLSLRWLSSKVYTSHTGSEAPKRKRRWLTILSAAALVPLFVMMSIVQVVLSAKSLSPEIISDDNVTAWLLVLGFLGFILHGFVWGVGWFAFASKGWLGQSRRHVRKWAKLPDPISLPPLPPLIIDTDAPPPL